jgi:hypothetical protein
VEGAKVFIGREKELKKLERMYQSGKLEVGIVYGRRRVGKTTLINEFCKGKKTIFFAAQESSAGQNLETLSNAIMEAAAGESSAGIVFRSFSDAFLKIAEMAQTERVIWVIDEYPYLAQAEAGISSLLQNYLDHPFKDTKLFLILCGSSMSFMENQVLGYQSPLYGRRTAQFKILPFDYLDTGKWFPTYSLEEKALMYGVTGGIPMYLEQFSSTFSVRENLLENLFDRNATLFEEPSNLLKQELREPATYNAVITAIAGGKTKMSEIASTVGIETGLCAKYITNLITLGIIKRETPVTEQNSKRTIYLIEDQFFRFWYTFVPKNMSAIMSGRIEKAYPSVIESRLSDYMGLTFEKMCRDYIMYYDEKLSFPIGDVGQWWGGNKRTHKQAQIDVVVTSANDDSGIIGSCKFRDGFVAEDELRLMEDYADAMGYFGKRYYYLFSKSGFSETLTQKEKTGDGNLRLITLKDMYEQPNLFEKKVEISPIV